MISSQKLIQKQQQLLSQQQLQTLAILSMDRTELETFLQLEYMENPMLEHHSISGKEAAADFRTTDHNQNLQVKEESLQTFLKEQLIFTQMTSIEKKVKLYLIECIDDSGYFTMDIQDAAKQCNVRTAYARQCLEDLQQLEPVGIFSCSLQEYLKKQSQMAGINDPLLNQIIENHLEDIADGKIGNISRKLHISTALTRKYIHIIESFNPRPVSGFFEHSPEYVIPDIIISHDMEWEIKLNDNWLEDYRINDYYLHLMSETNDAVLKKYFQEKADRVRFILQSIEQRRNTILKICRVVLNRQKDFFNGNTDRKPLTMAETAEEIGVHPSTVTRAVKGKYIQYPCGTIPLKALFTAAAIHTDHSESIGADTIRNTIKKLILSEDKNHPYSDQQLAERLLADGITVSRRAIAKYRKEMGFKSSYNRLC